MQFVSRYPQSAQQTFPCLRSQLKIVHPLGYDLLIQITYTFWNRLGQFTLLQKRSVPISRSGCPQYWQNRPGCRVGSSSAWVPPNLIRFTMHMIEPGCAAALHSLLALQV